MFTEYEIASMIEVPAIKEANFQLKKDFIRNEAPYLEISDHDFFSLVIISPTLGVALANGQISLFEERALNKKARRLSKGGYFLRKDPVEFGMKFLIKKFDLWSPKFYQVLKLVIDEFLKHEGLSRQKMQEDKAIDFTNYRREVLRQPYILIRFISSFFLENDDEIISQERSLGRAEYNAIMEIGDQLGIGDIPVFQMFLQTFQIKG